MPVEIRELHIKVAVSPPSSGSAPGQGGATAGASQPPTSSKKSEDLLTECVEQVLQVLRNKNER